MTLPIIDRLILPKWVKLAKKSAMEHSLTFRNRDDFISFALGLPAMELFPKLLCQQAIDEMFDTDTSIFQYTPPIEELKKHIVDLMLLRGVTCTTKQVFLTAGAQQGISLLVRLLLEKGDKVLLEELAYPGILQAIEPYSPEILTVATDLATGIDVEGVEVILKKKQKPTFLYVVADGGNPRSVSIEKNKRHRLAELANQYGVPIIEDDPYGFLNYENAIPPLKAYGDDWIFYVGSFSKLFAPSFRTGWLIVPECIVSKLSSLKESNDINTATFSQRVVNSLLKKNIFSSHIENICAEYMTRRNAMTAAIKMHFPIQTLFHTPNNGIFIWVDLPKKFNTTALVNKSIREAGVTFMPSSAFVATKKIHINNGMRLNFSHPNQQAIAIGIKRLADIISATV